jgi:hypothetical protein
VRAAPRAAFWGPRRRLETRYFVFSYYEQDGEAVSAAAAKLEVLYPALYAAFFTGVPEGGKLVIQVDPAQRPGEIAKRAGEWDPFVVASPAAYRAPLDISPADLLAQSVVLALLEDFRAQVSKRFVHEPYLPDHEKRLPISQLSYAVLLWQLWATDLPLAAWRKPVVEWVFSDLHDPQALAAVAPAFLPALCAQHQLWLTSPLQVQIPLSCDTAELQERSLTWRFFYAPPAPLAHLATSTPVDATLEVVAVSPHPAATVALATLVEYAAAAYGRQRIPLLVASMHRYATWESLLPAVFGVPAAEFEAGWLAYLAEHYGVQP